MNPWSNTWIGITLGGAFNYRHRAMVVFLAAEKVADARPMGGLSMKSESQYALPANAAKRLLEIASTTETSDGGRIYVEKVNAVFLREGGSPDEYRAGIELLKKDGMIDMHQSGTFFKFTAKGAERFA